MKEHILYHLMTNEEFTKRSIPFIRKDYFDNIAERKVFGIIKDYYSRYSRVPGKDVINVELELLGLEEGVFNASVDLVESLESDADNIDWLLENTEKYIQEKAIHNAVFKSIEIIEGSETKMTKGHIPDLLSDALSVGLETKIGHDFLQEIAERYAFYHQQEQKFSTGIEMLDKVTDGGTGRKTLNVVTATTGVGKTAFMCHLASHWLKQGLNVLYITLEMSEMKISERIDANLLNISLKELKRLTQSDYINRVSSLKTKTSGRLFIKEYPTASSNVLHFDALIKELQMKKQFTPDVIFIDYLNIATSSRFNGSNANSYTVVKSIAEELRGLAVKYNACMWSATQLNRSGYKNEDIDMTSISESIGLPATVDSLFALISNEELEQRGQIMIKQLKNRYGDLNYYNVFFIGIERSKMQFYNLGIDSEHHSANTIDDKDTSRSTQSSLVKSTDKTISLPQRSTPKKFTSDKLSSIIM